MSVRRIADGTPIHSLQAHDAVVIGIDFSPDGKRLLTSSKDATVVLWNLDTAIEILRLREHQEGWAWNAYSSDDGAMIGSVTGITRDPTFVLRRTMPIEGCEKLLRRENTFLVVNHNPTQKRDASDGIRPRRNTRT